MPLLRYHSKKGLETAHRVHSGISPAFSYAIAHEHQDLAQLLRDIFHYQGAFVAQCPLRLSPCPSSAGEIRQMEWKDVDLDAQEWRYFVTN